ncbi:hypothetical protein AC1031_020513 [Aphanomyces cochlioides]|nr:hypothetical protein AC1031_020513 [Aphanomyces cochlioides]
MLPTGELYRYFHHDNPPKAGQFRILVVFQRELVVVPDGAVVEPMPHTQFLEFQTNLRHKQRSNNRTNGKLGENDHKKLKNMGCICDVVPVASEEPFWSQTEQDEVNAIDKEDAFDAFVVPYFNAMLANYGMTFIKSENQWLLQAGAGSESTHLKPNGFATHRQGIHSIIWYVLGFMHPTSFRFGDVDQDLWDCVILLESKLKISEDAFGQVDCVILLESKLKISEDAFLFADPQLTISASRVLLRWDSMHYSIWSALLLVDSMHYSIWAALLLVIQSCKTVIAKVERANWVDGGSKVLFNNFIAARKSPWVALLTNAC